MSLVRRADGDALSVCALPPAWRPVSIFPLKPRNRHLAGFILEVISNGLPITEMVAPLILILISPPPRGPDSDEPAVRLQTHDHWRQVLTGPLSGGAGAPGLEKPKEYHGCKCIGKSAGTMGPIATGRSANRWLLHHCLVSKTLFLPPSTTDLEVSAFSPEYRSMTTARCRRPSTSQASHHISYTP